MANYPEEGDRIMLWSVSPLPFKAETAGRISGCAGRNRVIIHFSHSKPGDKVLMSGPYGDFHPIVDSKAEMIWVGGGAGMAPLRAQIMWMTKTLHTTDRKMSYFYGAKGHSTKCSTFRISSSWRKDFPNFKFHLALDRPDPAADAAGVRSPPDLFTT